MANWKEPRINYNAEDQVVPEIFNRLGENEKYLQENKITTEQVQDAEINSIQNANRENLEDKESVKGLIGKIRKWLADLKALAFKATIGTSDIDNSAINASKIGTNAIETSKIKDLAVTDAKINSVSANKVTGLHKVATSGSYNDLKDKPEMGGGDNPKVVFEGNANYYTYRFNFDMKGEYRYLVEIGNGYGIGISSKNAPNDHPILNVLIPGYCYGTDRTLSMYLITIVGYESGPSYEGGGKFYIEGDIEVSKGIVDKEGYMHFNGESCPVIKKIVELGRAY